MQIVNQGAIYDFESAGLRVLLSPTLLWGDDKKRNIVIRCKNRLQS